MIHIGEYNTLTILREKEPGLFLSDEEDNDNSNAVYSDRHGKCSCFGINGDIEMILCDNCGKEFTDGNEWKDHAGKCSIANSRWI